jgi:hypothetical protein
MWWERNEREPLGRFGPAIIAYLGREPYTLFEHVPANSVSEGLHRNVHSAAFNCLEIKIGISVTDN